MKKLLSLVLALGLAVALGCSKPAEPKKDTKAPDAKPAAGDTAKPKA